MAVELAQRLAPLCLGLGGGEIGHRLGLQEVELVVEKGSPGEFAGLGEAQPPAAERRHDRSNDGAAAVQVQFGDILAGDAGGARKPQRQAVVELLAAVGIAQPDMARAEAAGGFDKLRGYAREKARQLGIENVRFNAAGCLDRCEFGPNMVIYPEGVWYRFESQADIDEILETHLKDGGRVQRLMLQPEQLPPKH